MVVTAPSREWMDILDFSATCVIVSTVQYTHSLCTHIAFLGCVLHWSGPIYTIMYGMIMLTRTHIDTRTFHINKCTYHRVYAPQNPHADILTQRRNNV